MLPDHAPIRASTTLPLVFNRTIPDRLSRTMSKYAGIINTLRRAQEVTGVDKIYALVGGFHLAPAPDDYLRQVMTELNKFNLQHVLPMHCSGMNFVELAKQEMPEKLVLCATGSRFTFSA
jgi:7,8-dihydropterin-6-yl-methyl-4-(beta-D-ribofuranosyl)aminobenzene 5'-phosphate synthase